MTVQSGRSKRKETKGPSCDECFFRCHGLCALDLDGPCSTFRPNGPDGLVPPRQPALLLRAIPGDDATADELSPELARTA